MTLRGIIVGGALLYGGWACGLACGSAGAQTPGSEKPVPQQAAPAEVNPPRVPKNSTQVAPVAIKAGDDSGEKGEAPLDTAPLEPPTDASAVSSPVSPERVGLYLRPGTRLQVRLDREIDSGKDHNGEAVAGTLLDAVTVSNGRVIPAGAAVLATVVSAAAAGTLRSAGLLTLQIDQVGPVAVITNVLSFDGKEGAKVLADSAPAKGTEAAVLADAILPFEVMGAGNVPLDRPEGASPAGHGGASGHVVPQAGKAQGSAAPGTSPVGGAQSPAPQATSSH